MSIENPLWFLVISVKLQAVAPLSLCMPVRITACVLSAAFCAYRLVTSVWRLQVTLKMLPEETLPFSYRHMKKQTVVKKDLLIWQEYQSGNLEIIMTQTICVHPPVQLATSRNTAYRGTSYDAWGTQQTECQAVRCLWVLKRTFQLLTIRWLIISTAS